MHKKQETSDFKHHWIKFIEQVMNQHRALRATCLCASVQQFSANVAKMVCILTDRCVRTCEEYFDMTEGELKTDVRRSNSTN